MAMSRVAEFEKFLKQDMDPAEDRELYQVGMRSGCPKLIIRLAFLVWCALKEKQHE
jgi:hypothetical protein